MEQDNATSATQCFAESEAEGKSRHGDMLYDAVLNHIASNVKLGPFLATSGVVLPYYLNLQTNFLDKKVASRIVKMLETEILEKFSSLGHVCLFGMEVAGGVLVSQLAASVSSPLHSWCDFCYVRKSRKSTGTQQQLEGPKELTERTSFSPAIKGIWLDDTLSTGSSLLEGVRLLKRDYNVEVVGAVYLVDRDRDRASLPLERQWLLHKEVEHVVIAAVYSLEQIDALVPKTPADDVNASHS
eukprot:ANDGO_07008.mRNA.1 Orotate phosphoribosyltransferase